MDLPPQPPPDAPAPLPGPEAIRSRRIMKRIIVVGMLCTAGVLVVKFGSRGFFKKADANGMQALVNAKQVFIALLDFNNDYGKFPEASTMAAVKTATGTTLPLGASSSNELFRQLIAAGHKSEQPFWAKSTHTPLPPDNIISGRHALEKGECSFAYVAGLVPASTPDKPFLFAPMDPVTKCFERRRDYRECAVIVFVDGSAIFLPIDKHGQVEIGGMNLFDPRQPFWKGKAPDIKWPE